MTLGCVDLTYCETPIKYWDLIFCCLITWRSFLFGQPMATQILCYQTWVLDQTCTKPKWLIKCLVTRVIYIYLVQILYMQRTSVDSYVTSWLGLKISEFFLHNMDLWCMDFTSLCGLFDPKYSLHWLGSWAISFLTLIIGLLMVHAPICFTRSTSRPVSFCYVTCSWLTFLVCEFSYRL